MHFVTVRELRLNPGAVWEKLEREKALVITSNGRPVGFLSDLPAGDVEETFLLWRRLRAEKAVSVLRRSAKAKGLHHLSSNDIDREIRAVRRQRRH